MALTNIQGGQFLVKKSFPEHRKNLGMSLMVTLDYLNLIDLGARQEVSEAHFWVCLGESCSCALGYRCCSSALPPSRDEFSTFFQIYCL